MSKIIRKVKLSLRAKELGSNLDELSAFFVEKGDKFGGEKETTSNLSLSSKGELKSEFLKWKLLNALNTPQERKPTLELSQWKRKRESERLQQIRAIKPRRTESSPIIEPIQNKKTIALENNLNINSSGIEKRKVFIVHGHDNGAISSVSEFLKDLGLVPVILRKEPDQGRTIIEKLMEKTSPSEICFAVVLYTPCDIGCEAPGVHPENLNTKSQKEVINNLKFRARQNVVFEHGLLLANLGRGRVFALKKGDIELPGDFSGVIYTPMEDNGEWKNRLGKELEVARLIGEKAPHVPDTSVRSC